MEAPNVAAQAERPGQRLPFAVAATLIATIWALAAMHAIPDGVAIAACTLVLAGTVWLGFARGFLEREVSGRLARMGVPVVIAMISQNLVNIVDTAFIGMLPAEVALPGTAALGVSLPVFWLVGGFLSAIAIGTQAITARRHGEGAEEDAGKTLMTAAAMAFVLGVAFSVIGYYILPLALPLVNSDPSVLEQGIPFSRIRYIGISSMVITAAYKAFFDATGKTYVHMVAAIVMNVVNIVLCWGLIFGNLGMPRLEVAGAAWASTLSSLIGTVVMIAWSFGPDLRRQYKLYRRGSFSWDLAGSIVRLSLPSGGATVIGMTGFLLFIAAVSQVDKASGSNIPVNASATTVILQLVLLIFLIAFAFGTATAALVSQSLGAKDPTAASRYAWESVKLGTILMIALASILFVFPEQVVGQFMREGKLDASSKDLVIAASATPLRIVAGATTLLGAGVIFIQSLYGAGNTRFVMLVELGLHFGCLVPLAWVFGVVLGWGLVGIWSAGALYIVLLALIMGWKFAEGSWKRIDL
ncbi:MATE family efflux transporter [Myxococcota bacterium]|nr:MATE family efflux transporter [Myxococcota bacterium]